MKGEVGFKTQTGPTPNFIRELFREDALVARQILREVMLGGLELTAEGAEAANAQGLEELGCTLTMPLQVATMDQRITAAKAVIQTAVGFKTDHTTDDEPLRRGVALFPEWQDRKTIAPAQGALTSGESSGNGGKGNGGKKKRATKKK